MLVRKYICPSCGGNKTDNISTGYIYCDYCSSLIDFDMEKMTEESTEAFSVKDNKQNQELYLQKLQELAKHIKSENENEFVKTQCEIHALEFEMFPKRFSPKIKQNVFKQKLLDYYEAYWHEKIKNAYFNENKETQKLFTELNSSIKFSYEDGKYIPEYDDDFVNYIDKMDEFIKTSIETNMQMTSIEKYPEPINSQTKEVMYKQSMNMLIQIYDAETIKKLINKLGFKSEYIEIESIALSQANCFVCNHEINIPEGSKRKICENCGTTNDIEKQQVVCPGCAAPFSISDGNSCPYCGSVMQTVGKEKKKQANSVQENVSHTKEHITETKTEITTEKKKKKSFFDKLFG